MKEKKHPESGESTEEIESEEQSESPLILSDDFVERDEAALKWAKEEVLFKDPHAELKIDIGPDGEKFAAIIDGEGKTVYFSKWADDIEDLEQIQEEK